MKIEDQVVSLELAKRLRELGVEQQSYFYWIKVEENKYWVIRSDIIKRCDSDCSAFTVAELGEMIPARIYTRKYVMYDRWRCVNPLKRDMPIIHEENEANARAKMLIYLLENGLIKNTDGDN